MSEIMDSVQIESSERQISGLCGAQEFYSRRETITRQACQGRTWETEATLVLAKRYSQREEVAADKCIAALWIFQTWRCFMIPASHHDIIIKPILHLFTALPSVFLLLNQDDFFSFQLLMLCYISFIFFSHIYIFDSWVVFLHGTCVDIIEYIYDVTVSQFSWKSQVLDIIT